MVSIRPVVNHHSIFKWKMPSDGFVRSHAAFDPKLPSIQSTATVTSS